RETRKGDELLLVALHLGYPFDPFDLAPAFANFGVASRARLSLPTNFTHLLGRGASIGSPKEAPASAGLRARLSVRNDRATEHGNISHLVANEVEAFGDERGGSLAVPRKASFWRSQGRLSVSLHVSNSAVGAGY